MQSQEKQRQPLGRASSSVWLGPTRTSPCLRKENSTLPLSATFPTPPFVKAVLTSAADRLRLSVRPAHPSR